MQNFPDKWMSGWGISLIWEANLAKMNHNELQCIISKPSKIIGISLPSVDSVHTLRTLKQAKRIITDPSHPEYHHYSLSLRFSSLCKNAHVKLLCNFSWFSYTKCCILYIVLYNVYGILVLYCMFMCIVPQQGWITSRCTGYNYHMWCDNKKKQKKIKIG